MSQESTSSGTPVRDGCPICAGTDRRVAGGLVGWHDRGHNPMQSPERFAIDAAGYVWRVFAGAGLDGGDLWSMAPSNPDNAPIPGPVRYYAPEDVDRDRIVAGTLRSLAEALSGVGSMATTAIDQLRDLAFLVDPDAGAAGEEFDLDGVRRCRGCGCTDTDCSQCIERTGQPCSWVEPDLCSACASSAVTIGGR